MRGKRVKSIEELLFKRYRYLVVRAKEVRASNRMYSDQLIKEASVVLLQLQKLKQSRKFT